MKPEKKKKRKKKGPLIRTVLFIKLVQLSKHRLLLLFVLDGGLVRCIYRPWPIQV